MSRRCHHGSPRHARPIGRERRRGPALADRPASALPEVGGSEAVDQAYDGTEAERGGEPGDLGPAAVDETPTEQAADLEPAAAQPPAAGRPPAAGQLRRAPASEPPARESRPHPVMARAPVPRPAPRSAEAREAGPAELGNEHGATAPQLRRFIKSRAYVPMHELRRRFVINGDDDDVTPIDVEHQRVYVGLPLREGRLLGELLRGGDIGVELSLDPIAPIVVGVYPMRPIPRS